MSKYHSTKTEVDGILFDSKKEASRYKELKMLSMAGEISDLAMQVKYQLIPAQYGPDITTKTGKVKKGKLLERECNYLADFVYTTKDGNTVVEDTKGMRTADYKIKRKLMLYVHGIEIAEI